jgi:3-hydroxyisobutyrate dehydrogenase
MGKKIGFIGLGTMGRPMASNLLARGHALYIFDIDRSRALPLQEKGAQVAESARDAAGAADVVITMLPASRHVLAATLGPDGAVEGLRQGATVIDMSTVDPGTTRRIAEAVAARRCLMLDAPVSGSSIGARDATLTIMVGGDPEVVEANRDVLGAMGSNVIHCGPLGMGETVKLANNLLAGTSMVAVAEAFALGIRGGADPRVLMDVISKSTGNCWMLRRAPVPGLVAESPVNNGFEPGFMVDLMHKDLGLALNAGTDFGLSLTLTALTHQLYGLASRHGYGRLDMSAVAKLLEGTADPPDRRLWDIQLSANGRETEVTSSAAAASEGPTDVTRALMLVDGEWRESARGAFFVVESPAHRGRVIAEVPRADAADVEIAVGAAARAFEFWKLVAPRERGKLMLQIADDVERRAEEMATLLATETGNAIRPQARPEIRGAAEVFRYFGGVASEIKGSVIPLGEEMLSYSRREPIGVVGGIIPWNSPVLLGALKIAMAVTAGNTLVLKAAEDAPLAVLGDRSCARLPIGSRRSR